jgi:restriction endonuclease Mrr
VERVQKEHPRGQLSEAELKRVALRVISRGIDVEDLTFGEILFIEAEAHKRERISWACSAQSKEILPKETTRPTKETMKNYRENMNQKLKAAGYVPKKPKPPPREN